MDIQSSSAPLLELEDPASGLQVALFRQLSTSHACWMRSISFSQIPDVTIRIQRPGEPPQVLLFDPKYKLDSELIDDGEAIFGKPKKVDIDKMHAYRDAIRDSRGQRIVALAAILYPGSNAIYGAGLEAIQAHPERAELLEESLMRLFGEFLGNSGDGLSS